MMGTGPKPFLWENLYPSESSDRTVKRDEDTIVSQVKGEDAISFESQQRNRIHTAAGNLSRSDFTAITFVADDSIWFLKPQEL